MFMWFVEAVSKTSEETLEDVPWVVLAGPRSLELQTTPSEEGHGAVGEDVKTYVGPKRPPKHG